MSKIETVEVISTKEDGNTFIVDSGFIIASDPCYDKSLTSLKDNIPVVNGMWKYKLIRSDFGISGNRNCKLIIWNDDSYNSEIKCDNFEEIHNCCVDSGQFGFFDFKKYPEGDTGKFGHLDTFYGRACDITLNSKTLCGIIDNIGVVSSSGFGDGTYSVSGRKNKDGLYDVLQVVFIDEKEIKEHQDTIQQLKRLKG
jgi:hypothetical protein